MSRQSLYLITPDIPDAAAFLPLLQSVLAAAPVGAVLLRLSGDEDTVTRGAKLLAPVVQDAGAAAILDNPADLRIVARSGADGAHLPLDSDSFKDALDSLKPDRIVGVGGLRTRHEMMDVGEKPIDYLMFGEPRPDGSIPEVERVVERAEWWAEIFNVPCVAYAADLAAVPAVAATGADFVALGPWIFDSADPAQTVREAASLAVPPKKTK